MNIFATPDGNGDREAMPQDSAVYKICRDTEWTAAQNLGNFEGSADDRRDGYIHLSTLMQLPITAARHFSGIEGLVLVAFSAEALGPSLRWERSRGGQLFPHLFGPLPARKALWVRPLSLGPDGAPLIPEDLASC